MCLILFALHQHPEFSVIIAANRDEFFARPTTPLQPWQSAAIFAGRDARAGGTWMGITNNGQFAALTNVRDPYEQVANPISRGHLVSDMLQQRPLPDNFQHYCGFNLLWGDGNNVHCLHHSQPAPAQNSSAPKETQVAPGIHGLSNASLNTPWPKVEAGKLRLEQAICDADSQESLTEALFALLQEDAQAPDDRLPDTGVGIDLERLLSACFIRPEPQLINTPQSYGTRCSTVLLIRPDNRFYISEQSWNEQGHCINRQTYSNMG